MAPLSYRQRKRLRRSSFAEPEKRAYPIEDESHARNALSRVSRYGSTREKARVRAAVKRRYPSIGLKKDPPSHAHHHDMMGHHELLGGLGDDHRGIERSLGLPVEDKARIGKHFSIEMDGKGLEI